MIEAGRARIAEFLARPAIAHLLAALNREGVETRIIGGAVRNLLLDEPVGDVDLATTGLPEQTIRLGQAAGYRPVDTGIAHGTVTLVRDGTGFEVTTLRRDVETFGRHATVAFGADFEADARRRDFTINALALGHDGAVIDYCGGLQDLAARRLRFIGEADARIREDYLRILRFFRFHAQYGQGPLDAAGLAACIRGRAGLGSLSRERVRAELMKLLVAPLAAEVLEAMAAGGLLLPVLGRVPWLARFRAVADAGGGEVHPAFRLTALAVAVREDAPRLRERLSLSNAEFDRVARLARALEGVAGHSALPDLTRLRHLAHEAGPDAVAGALVLVTACAEPAAQRQARDLIAELGRTPPFLLGGRDLLALGVPPGPSVGTVLQRVRHDWIEAGCPEGRAAQLALLSEPSGLAGAGKQAGV